MVIAGRASQEHLAPGGEYAEQKAESRLRVREVMWGIPCLSHRFPIGISRHVSDAGKFFLGLAGEARLKSWWSKDEQPQVRTSSDHGVR